MSEQEKCPKCKDNLVQCGLVKLHQSNPNLTCGDLRDCVAGDAVTCLKRQLAAEREAREKAERELDNVKAVLDVEHRAGNLNGFPVTPTAVACEELLQDRDSLKAQLQQAQGAGPIRVCLCGSTRYMEAFFAAGWKLTLMGQIVLSVGVCKHMDADNAHGAEAAGVADQLDELHRRKIDLADWVLVLNVGGYVGKSTAGEIAYAKAHGKPIALISDLPNNGPVDASMVDWDSVMWDTECCFSEVKTQINRQPILDLLAALEKENAELRKTLAPRACRAASGRTR